METDVRLSPRLIVAIMACAAFAAALGLIRTPDPPKGDLEIFVLPWIDVIRARGLSSISAEFSPYTPPYIYLLNLVPLIEPRIGTIAALKLLNLPFVAGIVIGIGAIVARVRDDTELGTIAATASFVAPTLLINAFLWGQADTIFTCFLVWFVLFAIREKPAAAALMFGLALSFKLQAMFLSPLLLYLVLSGQMRVRDAMLVPLVYVAMMLPAALAGRPWDQLLTFYYYQAQAMPGLSFNAPNPWWWLQLAMTYQTGLAIGLIAGLVAGIVLAVGSLRQSPGPTSILVSACACAAVMPYVLPNMTGRYFIVADLLTIALAFVIPKLWPAAALIQLGSLLAYLAYFARVGMAHMAFFPTTFGVLLVVLAWAASLRQGRAMRKAISITF